jgi:hypothetical protein
MYQFDVQSGEVVSPRMGELYRVLINRNLTHRCRSYLAIYSAAGLVSGFPHLWRQQLRRAVKNALRRQ